MMPRAICIECTSEDNEVAFSTVKDLAEHRKSGHRLFKGQEKPLELPTSPAKEKSGVETPPEKKPILLRYKFEGSCESCDRELDTIQIPVGEKATVVAYCSNCKIQVVSQEVIPIEKQGKKEQDSECTS